MIVETAERFRGHEETGLEFARVQVVGSQRHHKILEQNLPNARLILEPFGRNSAPAIAAISLVAEPDDLLLILPADHNIQDEKAFHAAIKKGVQSARDGDIVTFGIQPTYAATGYGYIKAHSEAAGPAPRVESFVEKPPQKTAEAYLADGNYYWNAGIFMFTAQTMRDALAKHSPDILPSVEAAIPRPALDLCLLDSKAFALAPDISIDFAVMEHAENVSVIPVDMGWSDVGDYLALWQLSAEAEGDNVLIGNVHQQGCDGLFVRSEGPSVAVAGVSDLTIVATPEAVMILPKNQPTVVKALGQMSNQRRSGAIVSPHICKGAKEWLWSAFDVWAEKAWDQANGGFVEQLTLEGVPDAQADRRIRVQARQIYSFSRAIILGWPGVSRAEKLIQNGLEYLSEQARHADGGWVHVLSPEGAVKDAQRDLYDHAFIILAGAGAYQATGSLLGKSIAYEALNFIDEQMKDHKHGGWVEALPNCNAPRRSNPHMHLLEAMLAFHHATKDPRALETAAEIVRLFEVEFFNPQHDILVEFFAADWTPKNAAEDRIWEPGHMYEWASLLKMYDELTGHDTLSWRRRMIYKSDRDGIDADSGFAHNQVSTGGALVNSKRRIWPQLERLRARLLHPETSDPGAAEREYQALVRTYLSHLPVGTWLDETAADGQPTSTAIPSSILYHVVTAFTPLLIKD
ncbi:MAG: AGE family epimerase/isomerase [Henriciella sp.]